MPTWLLIALLALLAVVVAFALGGAIVVLRRWREDQRTLQRDVARANAALAAAHAEDNGWDAAALDAAARRAFAAERPGVEPRSIDLVQVIDRPGIEEDRAVLRVRTEHGPATLTLTRRAGDWALESLS